MRNFNNEQYDPYEEELLNQHAKEFSLYQIKEFREFSQAAVPYIFLARNLIVGSILFGFCLFVLIMFIGIVTA